MKFDWEYAYFFGILKTVGERVESDEEKDSYAFCQLVCKLTWGGGILSNQSSQIKMNEDALLAVYIEDVFSNTIPNRTSGYIFDNQKSSCTNDATIRWDNSSWAPIITGMDTFKTTCNLYFKEPNFIKNCAVETCDVSYEEKKSSIKTIVFQNEITTIDNAVVDNAPVLLELDLSSFDTSKVTNMSNMFSGQRNIVRLDVSSFDTSNVTNMYYMFGLSTGLTELNITSFDTLQVTNMGGMFRDTSIQELNLSSFDTTKVTIFSQFFWGSSDLTNVIYGEKFVYKNNANVSSMFSSCPANKPTDVSWEGIV